CPSEHHLPIKTPVLNSFRHMLGRDRVSLLKVRDRARNLENPHVGSRREPEPRHRLFDQRPPRSVDPAVLPDLVRSQLGIVVRPRPVIALDLPRAGPPDALADRRGLLASLVRSTGAQ